MPTLPNYSTRFNPRTGEQSYLDPATNQWTPGLPTGQNVNPYAGMDLKVPSLPTLNPQQIQAMYGGGSPNATVGINSAINPVGAGSMTLTGMGGQSIGGSEGRVAVNAFRDYGPGANMTLQEANDYYANAARNSVPQYVSPGVGMGGGMPVPAGFPAGAPMSFGGGFGGAMAGGVGGAAPLQAPAQRTRVYGPSFALPRYGGRNS